MVNVLDRPPVREVAGTSVAGRRPVARLTLPTLLALTAIVTIVPFAAMVLVAFAPPSGQTFPDALNPARFTFENFSKVLSSSDIPRWTVNSLLYSLVSVVCVLLFASMAGYAFAKKKFPGREIMFWAFLATLMVPFQATLIPSYILVSRLDWVDSYWGLIVPTLANSQAVFLMRQFISQLPDELFEAAEIDGAPEWRIFTMIVLPLIRPVLATLGIFVFLWHWNDFLWPLVIGQDPEMRTLTTGIAGLMRESQPLNVTLAGSVVALTPIFLAYLFAQRYFTEGVTMTGVKG